MKRKKTLLSTFLTLLFSGTCCAQTVGQEYIVNGTFGYQNLDGNANLNNWVYDANVWVSSTSNMNDLTNTYRAVNGLFAMPDIMEPNITSIAIKPLSQTISLLPKGTY